jgi:hypothetical protein
MMPLALGRADYLPRIDAMQGLDSGRQLGVVAADPLLADGSPVPERDSNLQQTG